ncbi:GAF domain-containing protein [Vibrio intestinalis]|uniref:GAF domain-containing protein n=1 Tax=Vibrio intestinalis TaxID=2933291 RepID=UPI0021A8D96A|nr:GAF domain-containing protein [Vibrio intestinalis]
MPFKQLEQYQSSLIAELEEIAQQYHLHSLLIMQSTPDSMIVFAANQQPIYSAGDSGPKSVQQGCHELYCERVVNTEKALLVADAAVDDEWRGNEDLVKFGLGVYYGLPIVHRGKPIGTVCALNDKPFDFANGEPSAIERIDELRQTIEQYL